LQHEINHHELLDHIQRVGKLFYEKEKHKAVLTASSDDSGLAE